MNSLNNPLDNQLNDASFASLWEELEWRGCIKETTNVAGSLEKALENEKLTYYCGFDPTAPSLHLGNFVQLMLMRRLQLAGHKPLALVGGSTGLIGDPKPGAERNLNTKETVAEWVEYLGSQISKYLDFSGENRAKLVNNLDWTENFEVIDFLRDIGKYFRVGKMIKKDAVATRLNSELGISYTEFSYQILQGYDFLQLYKKYDCTLQTGGSDQWGNFVSGIDLIRSVTSEENPQSDSPVEVHAIGTPLITNADGTKFGKSEGNAIWLDENLTSPYEMYQFWINTADADVIDRLKVFTFLTRAEIEELAEAVEKEPFKREAQKRLAYEVTSLIHGVDKTEQAIEASGALFGRGDLTSLDEQTLLSSLSQLEFKSINRDELTATNILVKSGHAKGTSEARRIIKEGGAYINNEKITSHDATLSREQLLHDKYLVVRKGKKNLAALKISD
ncbi:MAG: tyrosine--tRNA ligase [Micrococcaceae bacterium]